MIGRINNMCDHPEDQRGKVAYSDEDVCFGCGKIGVE